MERMISTLEFFGVLALAIEIGFETVFSLPGIDGFFKRAKDRAYLKRVLILIFSLFLCGALYALTGPGEEALFLERTFGKKIPVLDVLLSALLLTGGSRAVHDVMQRVSGRTAQKIQEKSL